MKFMITWHLKPAQQSAATARFLETGGIPPKGVKMLGRWHGPGKGFVLAETTNLKALNEWLFRWTDLLEFNVMPVIEDRDAADIMKRVG